MARKRIPATGIARVNTWAVFTRAVEEGVQYGWNRAHKHTEEPDGEHICSEIMQAVENAVAEYFEFSTPWDD